MTFSRVKIKEEVLSVPFRFIMVSIMLFVIVLFLPFPLKAIDIVNIKAYARIELLRNVKIELYIHHTSFPSFLMLDSITLLLQPPNLWSTDTSIIRRVACPTRVRVRHSYDTRTTLVQTCRRGVKKNNFSFIPTLLKSVSDTYKTLVQTCRGKCSNFILFICFYFS
jgi:hypothetical protein